MTDFFEKGFACVELMNPQFAVATFKDLDLAQLQRFHGKVSDQAMEKLTFPRTPSFDAFIQKIEDNMYRCWERYGKKWLKLKLIGQEFLLFPRIERNITTQGTAEHMVIWVPIDEVTINHDLPALMTGSHLNKLKNLPSILVVPQGHALMFDSRLATQRTPMGSGGIVLARTYDMTGL